MSVEEEAREFVKANDPAGLYSYFMKKLKSLATYYNQKLEAYQGKLESYQNKLLSIPNTSIDQFSINLKNIKFLSVELFYIWTRIPPICPYCERMLEHEDMNWLRCVSNGNILEELKLDKKNYRLKEWKCDWNDRYATEEYDSHYGEQLTEEGLNYLFARGLDIQTYPSMIIKLETMSNERFKKTIRALGSWDYVTIRQGDEIVVDIDPETHQPRLDFFFNIKELILTFLEGGTQNLDERLKKTTHNEQYGTKTHDKQLFGT